MRHLRYILFPLTLCYWLFTYCRNKFFDWGILHQTYFRIPIISIGNITVGGTGKTPHVQYIISLLLNKNIATLSRGYKRKSKGFVLSQEQTTVAELGDEPYLLQKRFPNVHVAVCEKRVDGVNALLDKISDLQVVILDDAFQHRYVKPGLQIVLIDYNRPLWSDYVFPVGYMREGAYALRRADVIVVSKCPETLDEGTAKQWKEKLASFGKRVFFSAMEYGSVYEFATKQEYSNQQFFTDKKICLITGISQPAPLLEYVKKFGCDVHHIAFPDHYSYSENDVELLDEMSLQRTLVTTEKDVYKLSEIIPSKQLFVVPVMPKILFSEAYDFENCVSAFVEKK